MMRSVSTTWEAGLLPALLHLHSQARKGEIFLHQTASFEDKWDADCLNALYRHMNSDKWYPQSANLKAA